MSFLKQVAHLRGLAALDQHTTIMEMALINVIEELAAEVDRLTAAIPPPPPDDGKRFGTI